MELADPAQAGQVRDAYDAWRSGRLVLRARPRPREPAQWPAALARYPGLVVLVALAVVVFPFSLPGTDRELGSVVAWLAIVDPRSVGPTLPSLPELLARGEVWRWFTPMFLHFSVAHLAFNCAVVSFLGRSVERALSGGGLWLIVLALAGVSNLAQYTFGAGPLFGGLSGVAYGLLGFVLVMHRRNPEVEVWYLPPGVAVGLLVILVLFTTGVTEPFGLAVANVAHWGGLAAGALLGALWRRPA